MPAARRSRLNRGYSRVLSSSLKLGGAGAQSNVVPNTVGGVVRFEVPSARTRLNLNVVDNSAYQPQLGDELEISLTVDSSNITDGQFGHLVKFASSGGKLVRTSNSQFANSCVMSQRALPAVARYEKVDGNGGVAEAWVVRSKDGSDPTKDPVFAAACLPKYEPIRITDPDVNASWSAGFMNAEGVRWIALYNSTGPFISVLSNVDDDFNVRSDQAPIANSGPIVGFARTSSGDGVGVRVHRSGTHTGLIYLSTNLQAFSLVNLPTAEEALLPPVYSWVSNRILAVAPTSGRVYSAAGGSLGTWTLKEDLGEAVVGIAVSPIASRVAVCTAAGRILVADADASDTFVEWEDLSVSADLKDISWSIWGVVVVGDGVWEASAESSSFTKSNNGEYVAVVGTGKGHIFASRLSSETFPAYNLHYSVNCGYNIHPVVGTHFQELNGDAAGVGFKFLKSDFPTDGFNRIYFSRPFVSGPGGTGVHPTQGIPYLDGVND